MITAPGPPRRHHDTATVDAPATRASTSTIIQGSASAHDASDGSNTPSASSSAQIMTMRMRRSTVAKRPNSAASAPSDAYPTNWGQGEKCVATIASNTASAA